MGCEGRDSRELAAAGGVPAVCEEVAGSLRLPGGCLPRGC